MIQIVKIMLNVAKRARILSAAARAIRLPRIQIRCRQKFDGALVAARVNMGAARSLTRAAAYLRGSVVQSIKTDDSPSAPGTPPHSRGALKGAVLFAVDRRSLSAIIGPTASRMGEGVSAAHEFGLTFRGRKYPARPFVGPSLERCAPYLASMFHVT